MAKDRFVAWLKRPGEPGLGCSVKIGPEAEVEAYAREVCATERWASRYPVTVVSITSDPVRQRVVRTFTVESLPSGGAR